MRTNRSLGWALGLTSAGVIALGIWPQALMAVAEEAQQALILVP